MANEEVPITKAVSEAKRSANVKNAQLSTGPKTAEGKAISRGNALKHGIYAQTIVVPGENGELFQTRFATWSRELNPTALEAADYIISQLVRKSIRLDRCHLVYDSTAAELARTALQVRTKKRARRVEKLARLFTAGEWDVAVRRLREFPEGCDFLIKEWEQFAVTLVEPTTWDAEEDTSAAKLRARHLSLEGQAPGQLTRATAALVEHRAVAHRLKANEHPDLFDWKLRYKLVEEHEFDRERLLDLELAAIRFKGEIEASIAAEIAELRTLKVELEDAERLSTSELSVRARFDDTDRGKLLHRHETDLERGFVRGFKEVREMQRWTMQMASMNEFAPDRTWVETRPPEVPPARNEATGESARGALVGWVPGEVKGYSEVNVSITPQKRPKRKQ